MTAVGSGEATRPRRLLSRAVLGIVLATFFSDVSHELVTAVLPMYLATIGLGPAALGVLEGVADFLVSIAKLAGGITGHRVAQKRPLAALGYLITTIATSALAFARGTVWLTLLRSTAWVARGFRSPLRDAMLAEAVEPTHYGRAYGLERGADMAGAVVGPLLAFLLVWCGLALHQVMLLALVPGLAAAAAIFFLARGVEGQREPSARREDGPSAFPRPFKLFLVGVFLFGLGDFSRTFLIWIAAQQIGPEPGRSELSLGLPVLVYAVHNLVAALAAYPIGHLGDRGSKQSLLVVGYSLGVATNLLLALTTGSLAWLVVAIVLSGVYVSFEETLEKAACAELVPARNKSLAFGVLACANAVGDMVSSLAVGVLLERGRGPLAFGLAAGCGALGVLWLLGCARRRAA